MKSTCLVALLTSCSVTAFAQYGSRGVTASARCIELNQIAVTQDDWGLAQDDLRDALSMIDREPFADPLVLRSILSKYSRVLRKTHHGREARSIEARAAVLPTDLTTAAVVDVTDLRAPAKGAKK
jgi:hypothetical protein